MADKSDIKPKISIKVSFIYIMMYIVNHIIGIKKNKYYFEGIGGKYNDNARAVSEKMHELHPDFKIVWAIDKVHSLDYHIPPYVIIASNGISRLYHRATSAGWVSCVITSNLLYKSRRQKYVQCWHGDRPMKKILKDVCKMYLFETSHCDLMTSGSKFYTHLIDSAYNYKGRILETGCPRNDVLLSNNTDRIRTIKKELGIDFKTKILLYAPTFRDSNIATQSENLNLSRILVLLNKKTGEEWACLGRFHPSVNQFNSFKDKGIVDGTGYFDMADLLLISDVIITDYSSSASDFTLTKRPVFLYQPDRNDYISKDRELYFDLDKTPYWIAKSQNELEWLILNKTKDESKDNCAAIDNFYGTCETGHSSCDVVNYLCS